MTRCASCENAVIDDTHRTIWLGIHAQQKELATMEEIGPGGQARALRDLRRAEQVLADLGVSFEPCQETST
jgi:hypothetical protein